MQAGAESLVSIKVKDNLKSVCEEYRHEQWPDTESSTLGESAQGCKEVRSRRSARKFESMRAGRARQELPGHNQSIAA